MNDDSGSLRVFLRGFAHASRGIALAFKSQRNMRVHGAALFAVVTCGFVLQIATWEWCAVILASGVVMAAEIFNTSLEWLADRVSAEREDAIRNVKDAAAGAVLAASVAASVVGAVIFLPKLLAL